MAEPNNDWGIVRTDSGRLQIGVGPFKLLLPEELDSLPVPTAINDERNTNSFYEDYSRGADDFTATDRRQAAEPNLVLERFDDVIEVHITYRNDYGVTTEEHRQYSKPRQMALIPAADNVADDCHPLCILCFGPGPMPFTRSDAFRTSNCRSACRHWWSGCRV